MSSRIFYWIDHTAHCRTNTGMQRVVRGLANGLLEHGCQLVFVSWDTQRKVLVPADRHMLENLSHYGGPKLSESEYAFYPEEGGHAPALHEGPWIPRAGEWLVIAEVTHITLHNTAPTLDVIGYAQANQLQTAFVFYDAIPLKHSAYADVEQAHASYMQHIALADLIVPISQFAMHDLVRFYLNRLYFQLNTLPRIEPLLLPGEVCDRPRIINYVRNTSESIVLCIGTVEPRKNQALLIKAFQQICAVHPKAPIRLVLVGNLHPAVGPAIRDAVRYNPKIEYHDYADDEVLSAFYRDCAFTVFPSVEEGYGLPIIESLWHGKPCLCANFGSMAEVAAGGGCYTVDTRSLDELRHGLETLLFNPPVIEKLSSEIRDRSISRWVDYASAFDKALRSTTNIVDRVRKVYYWIDHTATYPANSGIQRVVRSLARTLQMTGISMTPVKWDSSRSGFTLPSDEELEHLAKWSGPSKAMWSMELPQGDEVGAWLLIPELTTYASNIDLYQVVQYAHSQCLGAAIVFYDAIPYKMSELYTAEARKQHASYMTQLNTFDKVLPISHQSRDDLLTYLRKTSGRLLNLESRVQTILLPGEFPNRERILQWNESTREPIVILSVGTLEPRKNHLKLIEAFVRAKTDSHRMMRLVLAGGGPFPEISKLVLKYCSSHPEIEWIDSPDDETLRHLYENCHFTVFPSLEEGFGLPIVESLWYARPCICHNQSAMREVGKGGGCLMVDTNSITELADAIVQLAGDRNLRQQLGTQATQREFKSWRDYGREMLTCIAEETPDRGIHQDWTTALVTRAAFHAPLLSICITTYNRSEWLAVSLPLILRRTSPFRDVVEIVVCDNASTDNSREVVKPYIGEPGFFYYRNPVNVGMLGNLKVTAHHARGQYVWLLGDDDLICEGTVERLMEAILEHPDVSLIYLNYAYTRLADAGEVGNVDDFLKLSIPITSPGVDRFAPIRELATLTENFFTAIYCLVFRRDHALRVYSQNTSGRPFSSMLTSIPTSYYICHHMMEDDGCWIGEPSVVVNMNVSWGRYAPLWILERLPELYDVAELNGALPEEVDRWRVHTLQAASHYLEKIYFDDSEGNRAYFSIERLFERHKHLPAFRKQVSVIMKIYARAHKLKLSGAEIAPKDLLDRFGLA